MEDALQELRERIATLRNGEARHGARIAELENDIATARQRRAELVQLAQQYEQVFTTLGVEIGDGYIDPLGRFFEKNTN